MASAFSMKLTHGVFAGGCKQEAKYAVFSISMESRDAKWEDGNVGPLKFFYFLN